MADDVQKARATVRALRDLIAGDLATDDERNAYLAALGTLALAATP